MPRAVKVQPARKPVGPRPTLLGALPQPPPPPPLCTPLRGLFLLVALLGVVLYSRPSVPFLLALLGTGETEALSFSTVSFSPLLEPRCAPRTLWSSDIHDGTRADVFSTVSSMGHRAINGGFKGESGPYPHVFTMPGVRLPSRQLPKIFADKWGMFYWSEGEVRSVFETYVFDNRADFQEVDGFVCLFPMSYCELWLPLNRSIVWLAAHRYSLGRCTLEQWEGLNEHMRLTASHPERGHVVAAMSVYDAEYINYFTGIRAQVISSTSLFYLGRGAKRPLTRYTKSRPEILIGPLQRGDFSHAGKLYAADPGRKYTFVPVKQLYKRFQPQDIANHRAVVLIPYAVMSYGITELYAMGVPMFVPSIKLLRSLDVMYDRRNRDAPYCGANVQVPPKHPDSRHPFNPEDDDDASFAYWMQFADYYQWPHITTFDSWPDLIAKLDAADFDAIHSLMVQENARREARAFEAWDAVLCGMPDGNALPTDYASAVRDLLGSERTQVE